MLLAVLGEVERMAEELSNVDREGQQVLLAAADSEQWLLIEKQACNLSHKWNEEGTRPGARAYKNQ
jgi:hypothetical protein